MSFYLNILSLSLKKVFKKPFFTLLAIVVTILELILYYQVLLQKTTFDKFWQSNLPWYNWSEVFLSGLNALLTGISVAFFSVNAIKTHY